MPDPLARQQHAEEHLALLRSYGNDGGSRGAQARAEITAARAELTAQLPVEPDPPAEPEQPRRGRGK